MLSKLIKKACYLAGFLLLSACQGTPQADKLSAQTLTLLPASKTIENVPFYPQQAFYCGPTTLAEVFNFYGVTVSADEIAPNLFIPNKEGSLQLEMVGSSRRYGFLPYSERGSLSQIMKLINDDIPVIVFQNLSVQMLPQWHYALVIGYDKEERTFTLHTGLTPNHSMSFELFERTWARANYWFLAPVPPDISSQEMNSFVYTSAAYDLLKIGKPRLAISFLKTATTQWPSEWLAYFLLANHFVDVDHDAAIDWFEKGYHVGKFESAYLNNYAYALIKSKRYEQAKIILTKALKDFPNNQTLLKTMGLLPD